MAKATVDFSSLSDWINELEEKGKDLKKFTEKALVKSHEYITPKLIQDMKKHNQTGDTEKSIEKSAKVEWVGETASVDVGFRISKGGLPSIFLMYGTPRQKKDTKLYNALYGTKTKKQLIEIQKDIILDELK